MLSGDATSSGRADLTFRSRRSRDFVDGFIKIISRYPDRARRQLRRLGQQSPLDLFELRPLNVLHARPIVESDFAQLAGKIVKRSREFSRVFRTELCHLEGPLELPRNSLQRFNLTRELGRKNLCAQVVPMII